ncbi:hypothetical protein DEO72_LG4g2866 [Vigna unguiculata]|uniref:Uncharacterized protein n=1 Tax=Vigna unguiculata TaxID=3917 RepID=A0A4D6LTM8_VIGUN|nr:hypothetical protein DEO72_LG4g2866 [Vigna unguiculata]
MLLKVGSSKGQKNSGFTLSNQRSSPTKKEEEGRGKRASHPFIFISAILTVGEKPVRESTFGASIVHAYPCLHLQLGLKSRGTGLQFSSRFSAERGLCLYIRKQYAAQNTTHDSTLAVHCTKYSFVCNHYSSL